MPGPSPNSPTDSEKERFDHPDSHDGHDLIGTTTRGYPMYYDQKNHATAAGEIDDAEGPIRLKDRELLGDDTSLGDFIDRIEEEIGWDSLSPFGEDHQNDAGDEDVTERDRRDREEGR